MKDDEYTIIDDQKIMGIPVCVTSEPGFVLIKVGPIHMKMERKEAKRLANMIQKAAKNAKEAKHDS